MEHRKEAGRSYDIIHICTYVRLNKCKRNILLHINFCTHTYISYLDVSNVNPKHRKEHNSSSRLCSRAGLNQHSSARAKPRTCYSSSSIYDTYIHAYQVTTAVVLMYIQKQDCCCCCETTLTHHYLASVVFLYKYSSSEYSSTENMILRMCCISTIHAQDTGPKIPFSSAHQPVPSRFD